MIDQQIVLLNLLSPNQIQTQDYINPTKIISKLTKLGIQNQLISNPTKLSETAKKLDFSKIDAIVILISAENNSNTLNSLDQLINNIPEDFLSNILILVNPAERAYDGGQHNHIFNYDQIVEKLYSNGCVNRAKLYCKPGIFKPGKALPKGNSLIEKIRKKIFLQNF